MAALVRRLGGLPLALERVAARGRVLDLPEMLRRSDEFAGDDPAGKSLREAVMAGWSQLSLEERACLTWLATFQWRWSVTLAEEMLAGELAEGVGGDVVGLIDRLVTLGLVTVRPEERDLRFWLPDPVRAVALEQAGHAMKAARDPHASIMSDCAARTVSELADARAGTAAARLDQLGQDLAAALDHLRTSGAEGAAALLSADLDRCRTLRGPA